MPVVFKSDGKKKKKAHENENKRIVSNKVIMERVSVGEGKRLVALPSIPRGRKRGVGVDKEIKNRESSRRTPRSRGAL